MASRDEIKQLLIDAKIGYEARRTTLPLQGHQDIRDMIENEELEEKIGENEIVCKGFILYPKNGDHTKTRLIGHLVAKELVLSGWPRVEVISVMDLVLRFRRDTEYWGDALRRYTNVVIQDFFDNQMNRPFDDEAQGHIQQSILNAMEGGTGVTVVSTTPLKKGTEWSSWYSERFLNTLQGRTISVGIG